MGSSSMVLGEKDFLACCGTHKFATKMAAAAPFSTYAQAVDAARDIWFNKVDVKGWLEAIGSNAEIGEINSKNHKTPITAQWSKAEQSTALATATDSTMQELHEWNARYKQKFGFVFLIFAMGRSTPEILAELKRRYQNRPIVELEIAGQEHMKIIELRLSKLFLPITTAGSDAKTPSTTSSGVTKPGGKPSPQMQPPITTHVLDTTCGCPAAGIEIHLEMWDNPQSHPLIRQTDSIHWKLLGSSITDKGGCTSQLMEIVDALNPGVYRLSFDTGKFNPEGFFLYTSVVFEIRESQKWEHFHVPLLLSPFSFSMYRGS